MNQVAPEPTSITPKHNFIRSYQACVPCRKRKVKCDLGDPGDPTDPPVDAADENTRTVTSRTFGQRKAMPSNLAILEGSLREVGRGVRWETRGRRRLRHRLLR